MPNPDKMTTEDLTEEFMQLGTQVSVISLRRQKIHEELEKRGLAARTETRIDLMSEDEKRSLFSALKRALRK